MVDVYTRIEQQPPEVLEVIARSMEVRASEPEMQNICASYMGSITLPRSPRVLEVGCGNGATTKLILRYLDPATLVGVDPAGGLIDMARVGFDGMPHVSFAIGDAAATGQPDQSFDLVIAHTVYSHLPDPAAAPAESHRVLKPDGRLAIFDGDYANITLAQFDGDPLQAAVDVVLRHMVHAPYVMRRLPALAASAGLTVEAVVPHAYVQTRSPEYLLTLLSHGLSAAVAAGELGSALADGFNREARQRVESGTFYGAILFMSLTASKARTK